VAGQHPTGGDRRCLKRDAPCRADLRREILARRYARESRPALVDMAGD
jgi:hypothetical protein